MAGEVMLINPRRRRRTRKKRARARRPARRRRTRARVSVALNPRRRSRRRVYGRRRRRNPRRAGLGGFRLPGLGSIPVMGAVGVAGGIIATRWGAGYLAKFVDPKWGLDPNVARIGSKTVAGVVLPLVLKRFLPRGLGAGLALGGLAEVLIDVYNTYVAKGGSLSAYETGDLSAYRDGGLAGYGAGELSDYGDGGGAYEGGAY